MSLPMKTMGGETAQKPYREEILQGRRRIIMETSL